MFLEDPNRFAPKKGRMKTIHYRLLDGVLYKKYKSKLYLKCLDKLEAYLAMLDIHKGTCEAHQAGRNMMWILRRHGLFQSTMIKNYVAFAKDCKNCPIHRSIQQVSAREIEVLVKPWLFRCQRLDVISMIQSPSSKQHLYIITVTNYFTKQIEAVPLKETDKRSMANFIREHTAHQFGIPKILVTGQAL